ncbi:hypothetical protein LOTGIDRAFT_159415 [Lottia gigantea]|uniref:G-protein coupled receptors family 1 profile domain-containing protein n=1 Tax=Lottia gigantea TaxID=225164 RepID=V4C6W1_LOTGI|nr:hypothetical protein LOTGIDRAFT_159415 [Lottia gigantea]ESO97384.1 hypothetical protein LOTGIDRAFT_159415 [Lottia gigantea]
MGVHGTIIKLEAHKIYRRPTGVIRLIETMLLLVQMLMVYYFSVDVTMNLTDPYNQLLNTTLEEYENVTDTSANQHYVGFWITRVIINGIFGIILELFGIIGNILSIVVLVHYKQKSSTPLLLMFLAVFDSIYLFSEMFLEQWTLLSKALLISPGYRTFIAPIYIVSFPISKIAFTGTTVMTLLITLERFIAVVHPLRASRLCNKSVAWKAICVVFLWAIFFNLPRCLSYTSDYQWKNETNTTKLAMVRTELGNSWFYNDVYHAWIIVIFEFILPFVVIAILNVQVLASVRKSRELATQQNKSSKKREGRLTAMVFTVTTLFFVCGLFYSTAQILVRRVDKYNEISAALNNYVAIADTLMILNCSINFILYCVVGRKFRSIFVSLFCRRHRKENCYTIKTTNHTKSTSYTDSDDRELHAFKKRAYE